MDTTTVLNDIGMSMGSGSADDPGIYASSTEPNLDIRSSSITDNSTSTILEHEQRFMHIMDFNEDMLALLDLDDSGGFGRAGQVSSKCMDSMYEVGQTYRSVHGYISLVVCIAGILMNILIVMVLTRKEMRTPINRMLTALAVADMLVMIEYIPFTLHMYIFELPEQEQYSHAWAVFVLFHSHFTQIVHTINIQLTITMSIWRYVALKRSGPAANYLTMSRCNFCIFIAYICPIIICIPNYLTFSIYHREVLVIQPPLTRFVKVKEVDLSMESSIISLCMYASDMARLSMDCSRDALVKQDWYTVGLSQMAIANNELLHGINFWFYSVFVKLIPCFVLTFFMCWLINTLYKAKRRHKMLQRNSGVQLPTVTTVAGSCSSGSGHGGSDHERNRNNNIRRYSHSQSQQQHELQLLHRNSMGNGLIEEKDEETTNGGPAVTDDDKLDRKNETNTNLNQDQEAEPQPPSVIYTPVSPLLSQGPVARMVTNPSYSRITYTTLSTAPAPHAGEDDGMSKCNGSGILHHGDSHLQGRRESNFSVDANLIPTARRKSISFQNEDQSSRSGLRRFFPSMMDKQQHKQIPEPRRRSSSTTTIGYTHNGMADSPPYTGGHMLPRHRINSHSFGSSRKSGKRPDRTSKLLVAVLCLFLLTEFPQGIMAFLSGIYGEQFFKKCYNTWAEVWDILALINSAINFILYCFMSKQFRLQFRELFQVGNMFKRKCSVHTTAASKANGTTIVKHQGELPTIV